MPTTFGVFSTGTPDGQLFKNETKIKIVKNLNQNLVRYAIAAFEWNGKERLMDEYMKNGFEVHLNVNWKKVARDAAGNRITNTFPIGRELEDYKIAIEKVISSPYGAYAEKIILGNEPTVDQFWGTSNIYDYINGQLKYGIEIAKKYNKPVGDGAIHTALIKVVKDAEKSGRRLGANAKQVKAIIEANRTNGVDFWNTHTEGSGSSYRPGLMKEVTDYLRSKNDIPVGCNEFGIHSDDPALAESMAYEFNAAGYTDAILYNGGTEKDSRGILKARAICDIDGNLNAVGIRYKETAEKINIVVPPVDPLPPNPEPEPIPQPSAEVVEFRKLLTESTDVKRLLELYSIILPESGEDEAFLLVANTI